MRLVAASALVLAVGCAGRGPAPAIEPVATDGPVVASTGVPTVDTSGGSPLRLITPNEYVHESGGERYSVDADLDPWHGDEEVRYAWFGGDYGTRSTVAVRPIDQDTAQFLVDTDRDGDLADETVLTSEPVAFGEQVQVALSSHGTPVGFGFGRPGGQEPMVMLMNMTLRRGTLRLGSVDVDFAVQGRLGVYGGEYDAVYFDTDGDGSLDTGYLSDERYTPDQDESVNLGGTSWAYDVSGDGATVTLTPLAERRPDRVRLAAGNPAPDFAFVDIDGESGRLSDYRGRIVLLYVWGTWCAPCTYETPKLIEAYRQFNESGFEILAVAKNDRLTAVSEYVAGQGIGWRQVLEDDDGPIVTLYRAEGVPQLLLIDRDGTILEREIRGAKLAERLSELIDGRSPS